MDNAANHQYFAVSPRGFANEVIYFRVPNDKSGEVNKKFEDFEDRSNGGYCGWTEDTRARVPGVAVDWADRAYVGF